MAAYNLESPEDATEEAEEPEEEEIVNPYADIQALYTTTTSKKVISKIRFYAPVDTDTYTSFGFIYTIDGEQSQVAVTKTYTKASGYTSEKFGLDGQRVFYADLTTKGYANGTTITVKPYYTDAEGNTVYGAELTLTYNGAKLN